MSYISAIICCALFSESFPHSIVTSTLSPTQEGLPVATTERTTSEFVAKSMYERGLEDYEEEQMRQPRGMMMTDDDYHDQPHDTMMDPHMKEEKKAVQEDPWAGYYDFIINEGSFKFWAVFQLATAILLIYSAFAAVYYAKFNVITTDYDYYDDFLGRSNSDESTSLWSGLSSGTFQRILDAISSKKYK